MNQTSIKTFPIACPLTGVSGSSQSMNDVVHNPLNCYAIMSSPVSTNPILSYIVM